MSKKEELIKYLQDELRAPYCYNCRWQNSDPNAEDFACEWCHRKYMEWEVSDEVVDKIVEIAMRKE